MQHEQLMDESSGQLRSMYEGGLPSMGDVASGVQAPTMASAGRKNKRVRGGGPAADNIESPTGLGGGPGDPSLLSCLVCGKNFVSFSRLKSHEKTHAKSRPFRCVDCGKTFTVRYSLICHTRVHTRERPYNCTICGSRFSQASSLKTHQIYKHTKDFPYKCKHCGRGFISPGQKHEHVSRTHLKVSGGPGSKRTKSGHKGILGDTTSCAGQLQAAADGSMSLSQPSNSLGGPIMTTASVQTHLSLPPGPVY